MPCFAILPRTSVSLLSSIDFWLPHYSGVVMREKERELHILSRRCTVANLTLRGKSQYEIARELNVNQSTVCRDLAEIGKEWRNRAVRDLGEARGELLERIQRIENES